MVVNIDGAPASRELIDTFRSRRLRNNSGFIERRPHPRRGQIRKNLPTCEARIDCRGIPITIVHVGSPSFAGY
jgi:hypothetical protein